MTDPLVSVVVLTYNGEDYLDRLLTAVETQQLDDPYDVFVIDSGSTDRTLEILAAHPDVRVHRIPNSEFGHGRTRDLAVKMTRGRYVAFLTQDAVPMDPQWLAELIAPFAMSERIALVTGRQYPRQRAFPLQRYDIIGTFRHQGPNSATTIWGASERPLDAVEASASEFHSDVNAAVRRDLATGELPFADVPYSEDQLMAQQALKLGYWRAYAGRAVVEHSNDLDYHEYGPRMFDETVGLRRLGFEFHRMGRGEIVKATIKGTIGNSLSIVRDRDYSMGEKLRWLVVNPAYQWRRWSAMRRASRIDLADTGAVRAGSLEHRRKRHHESKRESPTQEG
jgi:rhamnosyltransferase